MSTSRSITKALPWPGAVALAACLMVITTGCAADTGTVVVVTVNAGDGVDPAEVLEINGNNAGQTFQRFFDIDGERFPLDFTITPTGRTGDLQIIACTLVSDGNDLVVRASAQDTVTIEADAAVELSLTLDVASASNCASLAAGN